MKANELETCLFVDWNLYNVCLTKLGTRKWRGNQRKIFY